MRRTSVERGFELAVVAGALVGVALLVYAAVLAVQDRPVPVWTWVAIGAVAVVSGAVGGVATLRDSSRPSLRYSSGDLVIFQQYQDRRRRGTRTALDWKYSFREYLFVPFVLLFALFGGVDLLQRGELLWEVAGAFLVIAAVVAAGLVIRWLLLPVDFESRANLDAHYEEMRWDWSGMRNRPHSLLRPRVKD